MRFLRSLSTLIFAGFLANVVALPFVNQPRMRVKPYKREPLQDIVTWDQHSIFVHGERVLFYSGEYHPFRLPVPGLWLDVFQKIRALGYTGVSIYIDWALLEGKPGVLLADGIFDLDPFFEAAQTAGIYILARPGPYINAEVSGGGFPGWVSHERSERSFSFIDKFISCNESQVHYAASTQLTSTPRNCMLVPLVR